MIREASTHALKLAALGALTAFALNHFLHIAVLHALLLFTASSFLFDVLTADDETPAGWASANSEFPFHRLELLIKGLAVIGLGVLCVLYPQR